MGTLGLLNLMKIHLEDSRAEPLEQFVCVTCDCPHGTTCTYYVVLNKDLLQLLDGKGTQFRERIGASPSPGQ